MIFRVSPISKKAAMVITVAAISCITLAGAQETEVARSWAGMAGMPLVGDLPARHGVDRPAILVVGLHPEGPARGAGLQTSDVLLSADGSAIDDPYGWIDSLKARPPGTVVELEVQRDEATLQLELTLAPPPEDDASDGS